MKLISAPGTGQLMCIKMATVTWYKFCYVSIAPLPRLSYETARGQMFRRGKDWSQVTVKMAHHFMAWHLAVSACPRHMPKVCKCYIQPLNLFDYVPGWPSDFWHWSHIYLGGSKKYWLGKRNFYRVCQVLGQCPSMHINLNAYGAQEVHC